MRQRKQFIKDDSKLSRLVAEAEAERKRLGLERKPPDFKAATAFALSQLSDAASREPETIKVTLRLVNGQAQFEPSDQIRAQGNELLVGDKRIVVKVVDANF
jgi:hypothetical protein